jgi:hypothetical protein
MYMMMRGNAPCSETRLSLWNILRTFQSRSGALVQDVTMLGKGGRCTFQSRAAPRMSSGRFTAANCRCCSRLSL